VIATRLSFSRCFTAVCATARFSRLVGLRCGAAVVVGWCRARSVCPSSVCTHLPPPPFPTPQVLLSSFYFHNNATASRSDYTMYSVIAYLALFRLQVWEGPTPAHFEPAPPRASLPLQPAAAVVPEARPKGTLRSVCFAGRWPALTSIRELCDRLATFVCAHVRGCCCVCVYFLGGGGGQELGVERFRFLLGGQASHKMATLVGFLWDEDGLRTWCLEDWAKSIDRTFAEVGIVLVLSCCSVVQRRSLHGALHAVGGVGGGGGAAAAAASVICRTCCWLGLPSTESPCWRGWLVSGATMGAAHMPLLMPLRKPLLRRLLWTPPPTLWGPQVPPPLFPGPR
jgi:hypothetical protein